MRASKTFVLLIAHVGVFVGAGLLLSAARQGSASAVGPTTLPASAPVVAAAPYPSAAATIPGQFLAKIHTEALGRLPTQAEWQDLVDRFTAAASCTETVRQVVTEFYTSTAFMTLPYDRAARLLALFRGALNRELDGALYVTYTTAPWNARPWSAVVTDVVGTAEFATLAETICTITDPPLYEQAAYYWNPDYLPYAISTTVPVSCTDVFTGTTGEDLQALLERAAQMGTRTVYLPQKAVVWITTTLTFPEILQITRTLTLLQPHSGPVE